MTKNILVVEDDSILQENIKIALEKAGFNVEQLFDGGNVISNVKKNKPDLILLDLMLPRDDGFHVLSKLKKNKDLKKIPVVVLTVIGTNSSKAECKMLGAKDYLVKSDYTLEEIVKKIKKYLK